VNRNVIRMVEASRLASGVSALSSWAERPYALAVHGKTGEVMGQEKLAVIVGQGFVVQFGQRAGLVVARAEMGEDQVGQAAALGELRHPQRRAVGRPRTDL